MILRGEKKSAAWETVSLPDAFPCPEVHRKQDIEGRTWGEAAAPCGHVKGVALVALTYQVRVLRLSQACEFKENPVRCGTSRKP